MDKWKTAVQRGLVSGATSSLLSTAALAALGKGTNNSMFGPTNAISHWIWGDRAAHHDEPSLKYTVPGYLIHHASATFWAVLFERACAPALDKRDTARTIGLATAASAVACFTDYELTPQRLHPKFEKRLSKPSLAAGAILCRRP